MRRAILAVLCLGILTLASTAHADKAFAPGCGETNSDKYAHALSLTYNGSNFVGKWEQNCGAGPVSVEVEVQRSTDNGAHWNDVICCGGSVLDLIKQTSTTGYQQRYQNFSDSACGSGLYRFHVWDANAGPNNWSYLEPSGGC